MNTRPAEVGDQGVLLGSESHGSIATLIVQTGKDQLAHLYGDWRMVAGIVEALQGEHVEIVETEGSAYGAHGVRSHELGD